MQQSISKQDTQPREGSITKRVERQTARIPSLAYLSLAAVSVALSVGLASTQRNKGWATFVGLWVPSFLLLGIYNKLVKLEGSDLFEASALH